jgi:hypothetical protein
VSVLTLHFNSDAKNQRQRPPNSFLAPSQARAGDLIAPLRPGGVVWLVASGKAHGRPALCERGRATSIPLLVDP